MIHAETNVRKDATLNATLNAPLNAPLNVRKDMMVTVTVLKAYISLISASVMNIRASMFICHSHTKL